MSVKTTQLHGMKDQIESWMEIVLHMEGYVDEDYNPLGELYYSFSECLDHIGYALQDE